jgi:hypothetical protein
LLTYTKGRGVPFLGPTPLHNLALCGDDLRLFRQRAHTAATKDRGVLGSYCSDLTASREGGVSFFNALCTRHLLRFIARAIPPTVWPGFLRVRTSAQIQSSDILLPDERDDETTKGSVSNSRLNKKSMWGGFRSSGPDISPRNDLYEVQAPGLTKGRGLIYSTKRPPFVWEAKQFASPREPG